MLIHSKLDSIIWLIAATLASWRLTALLCYEDGPFGVFMAFRRLMYKIRLGSLVSCFACLSVWISAGVVLCVYKLRPGVAVLVFAVSGAALILERWLGGGEPRGGDDH